MLVWLAAALIAGASVAAVISMFWREIVGFLKKAVVAVKKIITGVLYGTKVFLKKMGEAVLEISRHYSKLGKQWVEDEITQTSHRTLSEMEVPEDIRRKAERGEEVDITREAELQLEAATY